MYMHARVTISGHFRERVILGYIRFVAATFCQIDRDTGYLPRFFIGDENLLIDTANRASPPVKFYLIFYNLSFTG